MQVLPARDQFQIGAPAELATAPRVVIGLGTAPDGLPWLLQVDRSRQLSTLFHVVPQVFGVRRSQDLPTRVRDALEREVASGLMGVHEVDLDGRALRGFVARKKLKRLLGPTLFSQLLEAPDFEPPDRGGASAATNVGATAARDQDDEMLDAVDRAIETLRAKRHLLVDLATANAYSCSVRDSDRALRTPSAPIRPLAFETLGQFGGVDVVLIAQSGMMWTVPLADRDALAAGLLRLHQDPHGGWLRFEIPRQRVLAQLVEIARSVAEHHRRERVHADLAPGNMLVCADGARAFDGLDVEAGSPAAAATFDWAAPEQIVGHPVDPRTDVYALGRIATTILGGVVFGEQTEYVVPIGAQRKRHVKLLKAEGVFFDITDTELDRAWQRAWQDLLGRSVAFDRTRRPATAQHFADELAGLLERYPVPTRITLEPAFGDVVAIEGEGGLGFAHRIID